MRRPPARSAIVLTVFGALGIGPVASASTEPDDAARCLDGLADDVT